MIKGKWKLLICTILVTCVFFMASNSVFAAINEEYYNENVAGNLVVDSNLNEKLSDSILADALGRLIYAVGSLLEWVIGGVFKLITGTNVFPWADAILFNAIPFLDINVFAPAGTSLLATIQSSIAGIYYTVLMLASAFFGVAVMVSAVKLVITAIAEDKAKYKKAIVDWLLGLVMLWGIHFFISFALYLNEELVKVASEIATSALEGAEEQIVALADNTERKYQIVESFVYNMTEGGITFGDIKGVVLTVIGAIVVVVGVGIACGFTMGVGCVGGVALATLIKGILVATLGVAAYVRWCYHF